MKDSCKKGNKVREWYTGDAECNAYSEMYECGGIYHHNYMDVVGNRDHDCFWDCRGCKYDCPKEVRDGECK